LPGALVGESAHFRLFVTSDADVPPGLEGDKALTALETNWADMATLLPLGDGKIEYHWVASSEAASLACESAKAGGCELEGPIIVAPTLPHQHELIHAYMELITHAPPPLPLLTEGVAGAIGCGQGSGAVLTDPIRWQDLVALPALSPEFARDGYPEGAVLVRYLIRTRGIGAFVSYYAQAPKVRDPALFADNFQRFWGVSLDDAWSAMRTVGPGVSVYDNALCPCSLPPLTLDQPPADDPATAPYWTIPDAMGKTIALEAPPGHVFHDFDCLGNAFDGHGGGVAGLVQLGTVPSYVLAPLASATTGNFISDTCAGAELFAVPADPAGLGLDIQADRSSLSSGWAYLQIQPPPGGTTLWAMSGTVTACATCAFDTPACPAGAAPPPQGAYHVRVALTPVVGGSAEVPSNRLYFQ
jgi:hypothetical protein